MQVVFPTPIFLIAHSHVAGRIAVTYGLGSPGRRFGRVPASGAGRVTAVVRAERQIVLAGAHDGIHELRIGVISGPGAVRRAGLALRRRRTSVAPVIRIGPRPAGPANRLDS